VRILLFACAESAVIDQATNRVSVFNFLEEISSPIFPAAYPQLTIIIMSVRDDTEPSTFNYNLRVTLTGQEHPLLQGPLLIDFQSRHRARTLAQIAGMPVLNPGVLRFSIFDGESEIAFWETAVTQIVAPTITTQPTSEQTTPQAGSVLI
jgi:hypothetical protein